MSHNAGLFIGGSYDGCLVMGPSSTVHKVHVFLPASPRLHWSGADDMLDESTVEEYIEVLGLPCLTMPGGHSVRIYALQGMEIEDVFCALYANYRPMHKA